MGDFLPVAMLAAIVVLAAAVLALSLVAVKKRDYTPSPTPADTNTAAEQLKQAQDAQIRQQEQTQALIIRLNERINELEQRLNVTQAQNAGQLNRQLASLGTRVNAVDDNMQQLQRLFRNVKLRGGWGEVQMSAILAQMLTPAQYETNVAIDPESAERVEFALKLPLPDNTHLWLPIDAKCPVEDFERWQAAVEQNNREEAEKCSRALARRLQDEARDIAEKYIRPPYSTDFALLFLPIEGIYQWAVGEPALMQELERKWRVIPTSPSTISAVLNLVQLSHRSLAISQSEGQVWQYLAGVKQEMANLDEAIGKSQKKATEMTNSLDALARRLRVLQRRLNDLEKLEKLSQDNNQDM